MADGVIHPLLRGTLEALYGVAPIARLNAAIAADRAAIAALSPDRSVPAVPWMPPVNDNSDADEFLYEIDPIEAERFRRECERDALIGDE